WLNDSPLANLPRQGGTLLAAGQAAAALGPAWGFRAVPTTDHRLQWAEPARGLLAPGTFDPTTGLALTYQYGPKQLTGWWLAPAPGTVWARDPEGHARWVERSLPGGGRLVLAGLPLAAEAALGDSLQARLLLERAAVLAGLPRLWPTPDGKGAVLLNLHIDSKAHIPYLDGLLRHWPARLRATVHITAGPDCDRPGDGQGFAVDDPRRGGAYMARLAALGEIGSHGGWAHNYWATVAPHLPLPQRLDLLDRNFRALAPWGPVRTYSSPVGYHPPNINPWLESHGVLGFYHTGEGGCPPTHAWFEGAPFGGSMWAFPVATFGAGAATYEFKREGLTQAQVATWFSDLAHFCATQREARLVYGHPVDFADMPEAYVQGLLATVDRDVAQGALETWTLAEYAEFLNRREQVSWSLTTRGKACVLRAQGPLRNMAFRVPGRWHAQIPPGVDLRSEEAATWVVVRDSRNRLEVDLWP
ncbi:MAG TPA: hypothetical protein VF768_06160, partial [Holophagaceae bacterium]